MQELLLRAPSGPAPVSAGLHPNIGREQLEHREYFKDNFTDRRSSQRRGLDPVRVSELQRAMLPFVQNREKELTADFCSEPEKRPTQLYLHRKFYNPLHDYSM